MDFRNLTTTFHVSVLLVIINNNSALDFNKTIKEPFGRQMCRKFCSSTCGCSWYELIITRLSCSVLGKAPDLESGSTVFQMEGTEAIVQNGSVCAPNTTNWIRIQTKSRGLKYLRIAPVIKNSLELDRGKNKQDKKQEQQKKITSKTGTEIIRANQGEKIDQTEEKQERKGMTTETGTEIIPRILVFSDRMKPCQIDIKTKKPSHIKVFKTSYPNSVTCVIYIHPDRLIVSAQWMGIFSQSMSKVKDKTTLVKKQPANRMCADATKNVLFYISMRRSLIIKLQSLKAYSVPVNIKHSPMYVSYKDIVCDTKKQLLYITHNRGAVSLTYNGKNERLLFSGRKTGYMTLDGPGEILYYNYGCSLMKQRLALKKGRTIQDLKSVPKQLIYANGTLFINSKGLYLYDTINGKMERFKIVPTNLDKIIAVVS